MWLCQYGFHESLVYNFADDFCGGGQVVLLYLVNIFTDCHFFNHLRNKFESWEHLLKFKKVRSQYFPGLVLLIQSLN